MTNLPINYIINDIMKKLSAFTVFAAAFLFFTASPTFSQEALKSTEEEYFDFLSLLGITERPTLNYRTLSDSEWIIKNDSTEIQALENTEESTEKNQPETTNKTEEIVHPWQNNNLGTKRTFWASASENTNWITKGKNRSEALKIYGPEWFNSYNTAAPYGQNDGALWQGKGYNTSLTAGARLEAFGFELTVKPQVSFSQNLEFDYIMPNYPATDKDGNPSIYNNKAAKYGYYGVPSIDAPQRFGNKAFWTFDYGDTEIRWNWHTFTTGYGTQTIWLGPAKLNPIIHSNNSASYPKFDIGLRRTSLYMPHFGWYLGDFEFRGWWGKLSESDYFDNDYANNNNLISGVAAAYSFPGIFKGLSIGFNRTMLSKWNEMDSYGLFRIFIPIMNGGHDAADQRFSMTFDYLLPIAGLDIYLEWARNDFSPNMDYVIRYPFHTQGWTFGTQKAFKFKDKYGLKILLELTYLECSADYDRLINWYSTFYSHGEILQGYTNKGQWLGAGIGTGGNSQYLGIDFYFPKGSATIFGLRNNPDLDYTMYIDAKNDAENIKAGIFNAEANIRCKLDFGTSFTYFITPKTFFTSSIIFEDDRNYLNKAKENHHSEHRYNFNISMKIKYNL